MGGFLILHLLLMLFGRLTVLFHLLIFFLGHGLLADVAAKTTDGQRAMPLVWRWHEPLPLRVRRRQNEVE